MDIAINFLKETIKKLNYTFYDCLYGRIDLANKKLIQSSGAIYTILIENDTVEFKKLKSEFLKNNKKINDKPFKYVHSNKEYIVLYIGKNIDLLPRIQQHFNTSPSTGGLDLSNIKSLEKSKIYFGGIFVNDYENVEKILIKNYPPFVISTLNGKKTNRHLIN